MNIVLRDMEQAYLQEVKLRLELEAKIDLLTRKVEYLSKNKCMGCIDSICDDCATEEEYLSLIWK